MGDEKQNSGKKQPAGTENIETSFTLVDDDGQEYEFELVDYVEHEDELYAILMPDGDNDDGEALSLVVLRVDLSDKDNPVFELPDDEETAQKILDKYLDVID